MGVPDSVIKETDACYLVYALVSNRGLAMSLPSAGPQPDWDYISLVVSDAYAGRQELRVMTGYVNDGGIEGLYNQFEAATAWIGYNQKGAGHPQCAQADECIGD